MQVSVNRLSSVSVELSVQVPAEIVSKKYEEGVAKVAKTAHLKGFRPGKAPRSVVQQMFGPRILSDMANELINDSLPKALDEQKFSPINQPQVTIGTIGKAEEFAYKATFEVQPSIESVTFEGLELKRPATAVSDTDIADEIVKLQRFMGEFKAVEPARAVVKGEAVTVDFTVTIEGAEKKDAGGQGVRLELGDGSVLPELEAAILGKKQGDKVDATVKFGEDHPREDFRNKDAVFAITINGHLERVLPEVNDEFAKKATGEETVDAMKSMMRTRLEKAAKERSEMALANQIVDLLNEKNPMEVPSSLVEQQQRLLESEYVQRLRRMGGRLTQEQAAEIQKQLKADAEKKVRAGLVMAEIAKRNDLKIEDADIEKAYEELAAESGKNVAKVKAEYRDPARQQFLLGMVLEDKVLTFIESKAAITEEG
jgi:trigger factor